MRELQEAFEALLAQRLEPDRGGFDEVVQQVDAVSLRRSAEAFGTPQYLLDVDALRSRASRFLSTMRAHMPGCE
ncbi:MAG: hypothetical protein ACOC1F_00890, partial [Myxococcota bacterium]